MRKVLIIAHDFPPISSSGSFRPAKFVKYLPEWGWEPYVIAADSVPGLTNDPTLLKDIPASAGVWRFRQFRPSPLDWLEKAVKRSLRNVPDTSLVRRMVVAPFSILQDPPVDKTIYWAVSVIPFANRLIRAYRIDAILTTSPPWSSLVTGYILKLLTGRPWIADMRDPWTMDEVRYNAVGWRRSFDVKLERFLLSHADAIVGVNEKWVSDLNLTANAERCGAQVHLITNGYDPDDFEPFGAEQSELQQDTRTISHFGSIYQGGLNHLLAALEGLDETTLSRLRFRLVGYLHPNELARLHSSPVDFVFSHDSQRITHEEAVSGMRSSHVLLLTLPFDYYPGKLFEYMKLGRPVLALGVPGMGAKLVQESGIGHVVNTEDLDKVRAVLQRIAGDYEGFVSEHYRPNHAVIQRFDRRRLAGQLARVLSGSTEGCDRWKR